MGVCPMMANAALMAASWLRHLNSSFAAAAFMTRFAIATALLSGEVKMCSTSSHIDSLTCLPNSSVVRLVAARWRAQEVLVDALQLAREAVVRLRRRGPLEAA
eukprot:9485425-Pyramimonas_sp.AAC.1